MTRCFDSAAAVQASVGADLGHTPWLTVDQSRIDRFADATDDHQWIHVDPARAAAGPFGAPIAHGFLTLSLIARFLPELVRYEGLRMGLNYGCDKVRFPSPVRVGSRIRGHGLVLSAQPLPDGGVHVVTRLTVEIDGSAKPACVADAVTRLYFA